eukprot:526723-Lingulodinium_polyedra.AAC.1
MALHSIIGAMVVAVPRTDCGVWLAFGGPRSSVKLWHGMTGEEAALSSDAVFAFDAEGWAYARQQPQVE